MSAGPIIPTFFALLFLLWAFTATREYFNRQKIIRKHGCQPLPSLIRKDPILGLDVAFAMFRSYRLGQRSAEFEAQHKKYGLTFLSTALGKTRIFTIDPSNLRAILATNFRDWGVQPLRLAPWEPFLGKGVMDTDGVFWKHSREMVQPLFGRQQITNLASFEVHLSRLIELIPRDGSTIDLQPLFARLILDFTTEFLFGESCESLTPSPNKEVMRFLGAFHYGQAGIGKRTQLPYLSIFTTDKKFREAVKIARDFVDTYVERAALRSASVKEPSPKPRKKYVLVDELIRTHSDRTDIRNQLLNTFLAAHDTTAVLITNVFFNLARHPSVYAQLRAEILPLGPSALLDADTLKARLPYLHTVVTETSRLNPVVAQSARIALVPTILPSGGGGRGGTSPVYVPQGRSVQFNFFALHRRPEIFGADAAEFQPERWNRESVKQRVGMWEFLPFLGGPRTCPAQAMALLQVKYVVGRLVAAFARVENRDEVWGFVERYRITTDSRNGCLVGLIP